MTDSVMCGGHTDTSDIKRIEWYRKRKVKIVERIHETNCRERIDGMQKVGEGGKP